jgi:hypothetical protein
MCAQFFEERGAGPERQHERERSGPEFFCEPAGRAVPGNNPLGLGNRRYHDVDGLLEGALFYAVEAQNRPRIARVGREAVRGVGRVGHNLAGPKSRHSGGNIFLFHYADSYAFAVSGLDPTRNFRHVAIRKGASQMHNLKEGNIQVLRTSSLANGGAISVIRAIIARGGTKTPAKTLLWQYLANPSTLETILNTPACLEDRRDQRVLDKHGVTVQVFLRAIVYVLDHDFPAERFYRDEPETQATSQAA